ncbi:ArsR family transcriptional regulator [Thiospirochaeta perfilievii]|uniref:ArsR family transcriptional regulator n=1 Tax=Thiospirochaeta perfilievii TaxID=252967 RepID=A0A5C1Q824_9SPIO|nr:metalloregulator ArsR/SmtB family transcription factor [Thiospirochaeta perfilievii]QEN03478.1 ArsR family transcriptional regulator [Thiospirochaeta perfilievii]
MQLNRLDSDLLKKYEKRVLVLKAMAHPTRLYILDILKEGTLCVCEINELIDADLSTISKHISLLHSAGLVSREKKGLKVFYTLETPCILLPFNCLEGEK